MSIWIEKIADHAVFSILDALNRTLEALSANDKEDLEVIEAIEKAKAIVHFIKLRIAQADPLLTSLTVLNNIHNSLQTAHHNITNYAQNLNFGHWINAINELETCCVLTTQIPLLTHDGIDSMIQSATEFRSSISKLLKSVRSESTELHKIQEDLQQKISDAAVDINTQKQRLDIAITTYQQQFSESQQARQNEFSSSEQARLVAGAASEEGRQQAFESLKNQNNEEFSQIIASAKKKHADAIDELTGAAQSALDLIKSQKEHCQKLVGIITNTGMAYGFQKTANEEQKRAFIWSIVAVVAMSIWIITGCVFFGFTYDKELTLPSVIRQFLISTPFVLLSGFAALRVSQHQKTERNMRKAELEIASIDPFLATLSDQDRNDVKREFATRYFGQNDVPEKHEPVPSNLVELAGSLVKLVQDLTKKP
ncbi:hypothetical protein [Pseudomonas sp. Sample_20]|uniref:hypothetical protein n=1 Tax=Pseudomonas sp. Sample_20 TaxID=2448264 RepID=UPI001032D0F2|nr:hypothetical protein [Pseudomonas sp. Sample_20]